MSSKLLTYQEVSALTGVRESTLYSLVCRKQIPHIRLSGRMVRFNYDEVLTWIEAHRVGVSANSKTISKKVNAETNGRAQ